MGNRSRRGITGTEPSARRRQIACCIPGALVPSNDLCEFATVSTCDQADYDTKISIFCPECAHDYHVVVAANDDDPGCSGYTSMTTWCAEEGLEYLVLVHGFLQETGNFELSSIDTGQTCTPPGYCE